MAGSLALSDERLAQIFAEVQVEQYAAEDRAMREKMAGTRCQGCDSPILTPPPSPGMRPCKRCEGV